MSKIIAIANQKGGVGKTTTTVNLSAALAAMKRTVLLIDLDPQGNATMGSGIDKNNLDASINELLLSTATFEQALQRTTAGYDLLPTNSNLTVAEVQLLHHADKEKRLSNLLTSEVSAAYDFILIDCPPSLNMLTVNALVASNSVLIPMQCEYFALEGLSALLNTIEQLRNGANPNLHIEGLLRTMFDARSRLTADVSEQLTEHFPDEVYRTVIPRNVRLAEAPSHGLPIMLYDKRSSGALAYIALAGEVLRRMEDNKNSESASSATITIQNPAVTDEMTEATEATEELTNELKAEPRQEQAEIKVAEACHNDADEFSKETAAQLSDKLEHTKTEEAV